MKNNKKTEKKNKKKNQFHVILKKSMLDTKPKWVNNLFKTFTFFFWSKNNKKSNGAHFTFYDVIL